MIDTKTVKTVKTVNLGTAIVMTEIISGKNGNTDTTFANIASTAIGDRLVQDTTVRMTAAFVTGHMNYIIEGETNTVNSCKLCCNDGEAGAGPVDLGSVAPIVNILR